MNKSTPFLPLILLTIGYGAHAQQIPGAGSQLRQIPEAPLARTLPPEIRIQEATPSNEDEDEDEFYVAPVRKPKPYRN